MFGEKIRSIRKQNKLSQQEFAELFHVTQGAVSQWERDTANPDPVMLMNISSYFNVSIDGMYTPVAHQLPQEDVIVYSKMIDKQLSAYEPDEEALVSAYRNLSPNGQRLLRDRAQELLILYGKKSSDLPTAESV